MGNSVLCIAKSYLLMPCNSHQCCNAFTASVTIHYLSCDMGSKMQKSQATREWVGEVQMSIREAKHRLDTELFLDEYPRWDIEGPHCPIILHSMFLHAAQEGQMETERYICQGHWHSLTRLDPKANLPAVLLVGYWTSWKEIQDLYYEVYLLRRAPGPPPCGPQLREEAIQDILSSLSCHLWRWGCHHAGRGPMWCGCC